MGQVYLTIKIECDYDDVVGILEDTTADINSMDGEAVVVGHDVTEIGNVDRGK